MRVTKWTAALICGLALALPVVAQDDAIPKELPPAPSTPPAEPAEPAELALTPPAPKKIDFGDPALHRWGGITLSVAGWEPVLIGADEELATTYADGIGSPLMEGSTAHIRETVVAIYHLPKDAGSIGIQYDSMHQSDSVDYFSPGQFIYGETRAYPSSVDPYVASILPLTIGVFDNGFADGVSADIVRKTREFRLYYSQTAFENPRAKGTWGVGYRQLSYSRNIGISYLAIAPDLPPLIPPTVNGDNDAVRLTPFPDTVSQTANFFGHGLGATLDLEFPLHPRVSVITGLGVGLVRGSESSSYTSQTSYYFTTYNPPTDPPGPVDETPRPLESDELIEILSNGSAEDIQKVGQKAVTVGVNQSQISQFAQSLDLYLGLEVKVYKGLKVFGTLRDVFYANVGEYVVPRPGFINERTSLSAGYEGYAIGLSWRY